jgi:signal transduction histidine kinase
MELKEHKFFKGFSSEAIESLIKEAKIIDYKAQTIIFEENTSSDHLCLILEGEVEFIKRINTKEQSVNTAKEGDFFGEIGLFTNEPRALTAKAKTDAKIALLPKEHFLEFIKSLQGPIGHLFSNLVSHLKLTTYKYISDIIEQEKMVLIGNMMNTLVHDFKNPFTVIRWSAQVISERHQDPDTKQLCDTIGKQIAHVFQMVSEINEFSQGNRALKLTKVNFNTIMDQFKELNAPLFKNEHIHISCDIDPIEIECEQIKIIRILQNLIVNAMDALENNPNGRILVSVKEKGSGIELRVKDNGTGIPEQIRNNFFKPFVTYGKAKGTGLGASIVKSVVEAHKGTIAVETGSEGTTFIINMPKAQNIG